ncbi:MAG: AI-2E family transporter [Deltaproteobacteria bacterium]
MATPTTAQDPRRLSNVTLAVLGAFALVLSVWTIWHFLVPVVVAAFLAALLNPLKVRLRRHFGRRPHLFAVFFTFGVFFLIVAPMGLLAYLLLNELLQAMNLLGHALGPHGFEHLVQGRLPAPVQAVLSKVQSIVPIDVETLRKGLASATKVVAPTVAGLLAVSGEMVFDVFVMLLAFFYLTLEGEALLRWIAEVLPLRTRYGKELFSEFAGTSYGMVVGSLLAMLLSGIIAGIGFALFGIEDPIVWGALTGLFTIAPAVGSAIIWVPICLVLAVMGHVAKGFLLTGYFLLFVVIGVDHLLRPFLVGKRMTLHPLLTFLGIFGGILTFGITGLVIGPLILALAVAILRIYRRDFLPAEVNAP